MIYITDLERGYQSDIEDDLYERSRNKRRVHSLDSSLDILNYAPYLPPQAEKTITGVLRRGKRRRTGEVIREERIFFSNMEPVRSNNDNTLSNTPGVAAFAKVRCIRAYYIMYILYKTYMRYITSYFQFSYITAKVEFKFWVLTYAHVYL